MGAPPPAALAQHTALSEVHPEAATSTLLEGEKSESESEESESEESESESPSEEAYSQEDVPLSRRKRHVLQPPQPPPPPPPALRQLPRPQPAVRRRSVRLAAV